LVLGLGGNRSIIPGDRYSVELSSTVVNHAWEFCSLGERIGPAHVRKVRHNTTFKQKEKGRKKRKELGREVSSHDAREPMAVAPFHHGGIGGRATVKRYEGELVERGRYRSSREEVRSSSNITCQGGMPRLREKRLRKWGQPVSGN